MPPELELPLLSCCGAPTTPAADESSGGLGVKKTFERVHREIEGVPPKQLAPTTPAADESSGGLGVKKTFERVHREIEGVPPKQLPAPASHELPSDSDNTDVSVNIDKESSA